MTHHGRGTPHGPRCTCSICMRCTCSICMPTITLLGGATKCVRCGQVGVGPCGCGFQNETKTLNDAMRETFDDAMREVQSLRTARTETLWKLFRLSLCQKTIADLQSVRTQETCMFFKRQAE